MSIKVPFKEFLYVTKKVMPFTSKPDTSHYCTSNVHVYGDRAYATDGVRAVSFKANFDVPGSLDVLVNRKTRDRLGQMYRQDVLHIRNIDIDTNQFYTLLRDDIFESVCYKGTGARIPPIRKVLCAHKMHREIKNIHLEGILDMFKPKEIEDKIVTLGFTKKSMSISEMKDLEDNPAPGEVNVNGNFLIDALKVIKAAVGYRNGRKPEGYITVYAPPQKVGSTKRNIPLVIHAPNVNIAICRMLACAEPKGTRT